MQMLKRAYRGLRPSHNEAVRPVSGSMAMRDRYIDIQRYLTMPTPIIIDGGASTGTSSTRFIRDYPQATIHAFEPIPASVAQLQQRFADQPDVIVYPNALGAENKTTTFNVLKHHTSSSILVPTRTNDHYHPGAMDITQQIEVAMVRLDSLFNDPVDLLKLDLQGYELEALKGCGDWIKQIKIITTEVEFVPLYKGQPLFSDIEIYLRNQGFFLLNLYELWTQTDGQLTAGDAVFLNQRYFTLSSIVE